MLVSRMLCAQRHTTVSLVVVALAMSGDGCAVPTPIDRAHALVRQQRDDAAVAVLKARLRARPEDVEARRLLIRLLGATGDLASARAEATKLARQTPSNDPAASVELGHALELAHRYDEALQAYDEAARMAPASPEGPLEGGMRSAHWGEAEIALPRLEEAVRRGARDGGTWHALGLVRLHLGDADGAEEAYRAGAAADDAPNQRGDRARDSSVADNWLGLATVALVRGDAIRALVAYDQVLARRPRFGAAELGRAWALAKLGRVDEASRAIDRGAELGASAASVARQRAALASAPAR